ncbi:MAG: DUF1648 domain-containing protein [Gammaproteobacteria bacterium]|nr:DUF1648 domain-containing protein [Gammaproteobacteria bacterium]
MARKISRIKTNVDVLFYLLVIIGLAQLIYYYPLLPETVASHFAGDGSPDGWMSRQVLMVLCGTVLATLGLMFYFSGRFNLNRNPKYLSLPHKEFWLQDIRREQAAEYIARKGVYFSFYTLGFMLLVMQMVFEANIAAQKALNNEAFMLLLIIYLLYVLFWSISFINHFRKIK